MKYRLWIILLMVVLALVACAPAEPAANDNTETAEPTEAMGDDEPTEEVVDDEPTDAAPDDEPTDAAAADEVEVFSWWTGGGEAAGLEAMMAVFAEQFPNIEFNNAAVAGGAGTNAKAVLATRLQASDPPDSWQAHAGWEIIG